MIENPLTPPPLTSTPGCLADYVCEMLDIKTDLGRAAVGQFLELVQVLDAKQQDYGSANLTRFGTTGVMVRATDKLERIITLKKRNSTPNNESLADSWCDLTNYSMIGFLMEAGKWPKQIA